MVGRGEILERMTLVPAPDGAGSLEALWQGGAAGGAAGDAVGGPRAAPVLLCPPHPRLGGSMDSAVLAELVWVLGRRRHPTLRFNHRGAGASQGTLALPPWPWPGPVALGPLIDDARAALAQLAATTGARTVGAVGVSVGALVAATLAATVADEDDDDDGGAVLIDRLLLVSPPAGVLGGDALAALGAALGRAGVAVAVVVGDADRAVDAAALRRSWPDVFVHVVEGADHLFQRGLSALGRRAAATFGAADDDTTDESVKLM
ncbi:MAG: hypothetical protein FJ137_05515 [Deltaproteobacteria bacterium]|nr:hypothetical protein [Deltaproteobacteria bacterium]